MDRACHRTVAAWQADPPLRALHRSGPGTQPVLQQVKRNLAILSIILSNRRPRRLDDAAAMPAADRPDSKPDDQRGAYHRQHPVVFPDPGLMRNTGILV